MKEIKLFKWLSIIFAWYDFWIGWFWNINKRKLYIFPIPCIGIVIKFKEKPIYIYENLYFPYRNPNLTVLIELK